MGFKIMDVFKNIMKGLQEVAKIKNNNEVYDDIQQKLNNWDNYKKKISNKQLESFDYNDSPNTSINELFDLNYLYHATYAPYVEEIKKSGYIKPGEHKNWDFSNKSVIYLSKDLDNAISYAETSDEVPEEYLDQIVVLKIDPRYLDIDKLDIDHNQAYWDYEEVDIEDPTTWIEFEYSGKIPIKAIKEYIKV